MIKVGILTIILVVCTIEQQNIQRRQLYYSDDDHMCHNGPPSRKDLIYLNIRYDDKNHMMMLADGGSNCFEFSTKPSERVSPQVYWDYLSYEGDYKNKTWIQFNQTI